jgi:dTDP-glucose 4,6-dehydratase
MADTRVLVTGGAGFLGSNFVRKTLKDYPELKITVLDKLTYAGSLRNLKGLIEQIEFIQGDILDEQLVQDLVGTTDLIVHFAAETHNDNSLIGPKLFIETNVVGTQNVALAASKLGKRLHHVSTDEVFGDLPFEGDAKFNEFSPYNPSSPYSASKASSDHVIRAYIRSFGLNATISNCSNNYGPHQNWEKLIPATVKSAYSGKPISLYGTGRNVRDWIHVDDHTDGLWSIINRGEPGATYLLGANNEVSNLDIAKDILDFLGKTPSLIEFIQDRPGHDRRYAIDATKARRELGWSPKRTAFKDELRIVVQYFVDQLSKEKGYLNDK